MVRTVIVVVGVGAEDEIPALAGDAPSFFGDHRRNVTGRHWSDRRCLGDGNPVFLHRFARLHCRRCGGCGLACRLDCRACRGRDGGRRDRRLAGSVLVVLLVSPAGRVAAACLLPLVDQARLSSPSLASLDFVALLEGSICSAC